MTYIVSGGALNSYSLTHCNYVTLFTHDTDRRTTIL